MAIGKVHLSDMFSCDFYCAELMLNNAHEIVYLKFSILTGLWLGVYLSTKGSGWESFLYLDMERFQ